MHRPQSLCVLRCRFSLQLSSSCLVTIPSTKNDLHCNLWKKGRNRENIDCFDFEIFWDWRIFSLELIFRFPIFSWVFTCEHYRFSLNYWDDVCDSSFLNLDLITDILHNVCKCSSLCFMFSFSTMWWIRTFCQSDWHYVCIEILIMILQAVKLLEYDMLSTFSNLDAKY